MQLKINLNNINFFHLPHLQDLEETGAEDNTTLLTNTNLSDED